MFSPADQALDLKSRLTTSRLLKSPLDEGTWALPEPAGRQNHAPQLCWLDPDRLACVWMAGGQEGTAGMSIYLSELRHCWGENGLWEHGISHPSKLTVPLLMRVQGKPISL